MVPAQFVAKMKPASVTESGGGRRLLRSNSEGCVPGLRDRERAARCFLGFRFQCSAAGFSAADLSMSSPKPFQVILRGASYISWCDGASSASARRPQRRAGSSEIPARRALSKSVQWVARPSLPRAVASPQVQPPGCARPTSQRDAQNSSKRAIAFDNKRIYTLIH